MPPCMLQFSTWAAADVSAPPERPFREGDSVWEAVPAAPPGPGPGAKPAERRQRPWGAWPKSETELLVVRVTCSLVTMSKSLTVTGSVSFPVK